VQSGIAALAQLARTHIEACSSFYRTAPVGLRQQPDFINAVCRVRTRLAPMALMQNLLEIERLHGRVREGDKGGPRTLDLDLLDYDGLVRNDERLILPHPRLHERAFVLKPLLDLDPSWRDPRSGRTAAEFLAALPDETRAVVRRLGDSVS